jgi:predicted amidohydrolase YtcJ
MLTVGRLADIAVVSADPFTAAIDSLDRIHAVMTIVGGQVVFESAP